MVCVFQELARERQENLRLLKAQQDKDDIIRKLREEIDLLNRVSPARPDLLVQAVNHNCSTKMSTPAPRRPLLVWVEIRGNIGEKSKISPGEASTSPLRRGSRCLSHAPHSDGLPPAGRRS